MRAAAHPTILYIHRKMCCKGRNGQGGERNNKFRNGAKKETDRAPKKRFFQPGLGRLHKFLQTNHGNAGAIQGVRKKMHALTG